jgi:DNA-binding NarL/FixJ family response regulator
MSNITCLLADDHPAVIQALSDYLTARDVVIVGTARDGQEALDVIAATKPQVAVVDLRMPRVSGTEVARQTARLSPKTAVILYTAYGERSFLTEALDAGASGFILKEAPLAEVHRAIEFVSTGRTYVDPGLAGVLSSAVASERTLNLTQRERETLRLLADGLSNEEIGKQLFISPETVRTHIRKAMAKLDADTRTQAVATALRESLIA